MRSITKLTWDRSFINKIIQGDALTELKKLPEESVQMCITSPPYYGLRDYGVDGQIGLEETPEIYVQKLVEVFREVKRVLKDDGTLWLNLGDSYVSSPAGNKTTTGGLAEKMFKKGGRYKLSNYRRDIDRKFPNLKPKDIIGIPWRVCFALQADGWYLRQDIIWCLSGGTWLYVRTEDSGITIMTIKDLFRLRKENVRLWNGNEWTRLIGISKSRRQGIELEIVLRSGERISCTPNHKWRSSRGLVEASALQVGDYLFNCRLPEPVYPKDTDVINEDVAWLCGLYLAEGSITGDTIQIAGHAKEEIRWERVSRIVRRYGGSATRTISGNEMNIRIYGKILNALISQFVSGNNAHDKGFNAVVWRYSNKFIEAFVMGYLQGDGHYEEKNKRWRIGFCRNYNLERDLRVACARLGWHIVLNMGFSNYNGKKFPSLRGEIRTYRSSHWNEKNPLEIVEIRKSRCREVYDIGVADEPHEFALTSGVLTHNSKPNPMPESVTDRCTKSHEYIFLLAKSQKYYFNNEAIKQDAVDLESYTGCRFRGRKRIYESGAYPSNPQTISSGKNKNIGKKYEKVNKRSVWTITVKPCEIRGVHFATFPEALIEPMVLAGSKKGDVVLDPFIGSGITAIVARKLGRNYLGIELNKKYCEIAEERIKAIPEPLF